MKSVILSILAIAASLNVFTQETNNTDFVKKIEAEAIPLKRAELLTEASFSYRFSNPDSSYFFAKQAVKILTDLKDTAMLTKAEILCSYYFYNSGNPDTALQIAEKNIHWLKRNQPKSSLLAEYFSFSGVCMMKLDKKREALDRFYIALEISEQAKDKLTQLKAYSNIGWAMMELNQFEQAIKNFRTAISFTANNNMPETYTAILYNNIASSFGSLNFTDSAYYYSKLAIQKAHSTGNIVAEANGLFILGNAQVKRGELNEALNSFLQAQPLREKTGDPYFIVSDKAAISNLYAKLGKTKEGIAFGMEALKIALKDSITAKLPMIYEALAINYEKDKKFEEAISYYKKINSLKDSMYADANPQALAEMQTRYETAKKEQQIIHQKNKLRLQTFLFVGIAGLIFLSAMLAYSYHKRNQLKKETHHQSELMKQQELAVKAVLEAEENERQRIAKDLHDGVGQMMSAAKMNLSAFEDDLSFSGAEQKNSFNKIISLVDESCREVRNVSHIMMPNALLKNGLSAAIKDFVDKLSNKNLKVQVYTEGLDERIDANIETVLYRVIQECVNNAIKHSGASTLDISVIKDQDGISGTIEDNGKGFDTTDKEKFEGVGLKNITTRIEYLKGTVDFDSSPGRGTLVALHVPLQQS